MGNFDIKNLFHSYFVLFYKRNNKWSRTRLYNNIWLPILIAIVILFFVENIEEITNSVSLILSILIGLLFNFLSSFSDKINSEHLSQNASDKINRLKLIKETSDGVFVTIFLSLFGLTIILCLTFISNNDLLGESIVKRGLNILFGGIVLIVLYQIFLMLIFMINSLRKLTKVDVNQEREYLEAKREEEHDDWE